MLTGEPIPKLLCGDKYTKKKGKKRKTELGVWSDLEILVGPLTSS